MCGAIRLGAPSRAELGYSSLAASKPCCGEVSLA